MLYRKEFTSKISYLVTLSSEILFIFLFNLLLHFGVFLEGGLATTVAKSKLKDPISLSTDLNEIRFLFGFLDKFGQSKFTDVSPNMCTYYRI